jgi:hypothetical protein
VTTARQFLGAEPKARSSTDIFNVGMCHTGLGRAQMKLQSKDESLVAFYENVRRQVELDKRAGGKYRLAGDGVRQYADKLREEIDRRRLQVEPIDWDSERAVTLPIRG